MRILFVHDRFPGQFRHLARALAADPGNEVHFLARVVEDEVPGVTPTLFQPSRTAHATTHHYVRPLETAVLNGQAAYRAGAALKRRGFRPDLVYSHAGFGPGLYLPELFPDARHAGYFEWFYRGRDSDAAFLVQNRLDENSLCRLKTRNAGILLELAAADLAICPTEFQRQQFPEALRDRLTTLHDGIDTGFFSPGSAAAVPGLSLPDGAEVVTYATRGMEPYRGFPQFMRAARLLQLRRPNLHVVVAGADMVAYSRRPAAGGPSYREQMLEELPDLDLQRLHFVGQLPLSDYRNLLRLSLVHVYLTVPFVLSWSLLEAMATGCAIVASDTAPVREVLADRQNGLLADFFSPEEIAGRVETLLDRPEQRATLAQEARQTVLDRYDLSDLLPRHLALLTGPARPGHAAAA